MSELIEKLFSRLSKYDWFTTLVPGIFLHALLRRMGINMATSSMLEEFGLMFFLGVVSSRVGATVVEQLARWCKLFEDYEDYIEWSSTEKEESKMLVRNANWFRSLCGMMIVLAAMIGLKLIPESLFPHNAKEILAIICLLLLFADSYRRQLSFTTQRIRKFKKDNYKEQE